MASSNGFTVLPTTGHSGTTVISITADSLTSMQERGVWVNITAGTLTKSVLAFQDNQQHYLTVSPQRINLSSSGGTASFTISSDLDWSFVNPTSWAVFSTTSGNGTTTVTVTAPANTSVDNRSANFTVTASGLSTTFMVVQPYPASFSITPTSITTTSGASSSYVTITSNSDWVITSIPNWVTASSTAGTGNDTVVFDISAFTSAGTRSGIVVFMCGGQTYRVDITQSGTSYFIPIPSSFSLPYNGGTTNLTISADCAWYVSSASSIVSLSQTAGTGNALITLTYPASTKKYQVSDTLVFTYNNTHTSSVTITQAANPEVNPYILFSPDPLVLNSSSGTSAFTIVSNTVWAITSKPSFVSSYSPTSGTGDTTISISYGQNLSAEELVGYFTVTADSISSMLETKQKGKYAYFDRHYIYDNLGSGMSNITPVGVSSDTSWYMSRESHTGGSQSSKIGTSSGSVTSDYINSSGSRTIYVKNTQPTSSTDAWCYDVYKLSVAGTVVDRLYVGRNVGSMSIVNVVPASGGTTNITISFKNNLSLPWYITCDSDVPQFSATAGTGASVVTVTLPENKLTEELNYLVTFCDSITGNVVQNAATVQISAVPATINLPWTGSSSSLTVTTNISTTWEIEGVGNAGAVATLVGGDAQLVSGNTYSGSPAVFNISPIGDRFCSNDYVTIHKTGSNSPKGEVYISVEAHPYMELNLYQVTGRTEDSIEIENSETAMTFYLYTTRNWQMTGSGLTISPSSGSGTCDYQDSDYQKITVNVPQNTGPERSFVLSATCTDSVSGVMTSVFTINQKPGIYFYTEPDSKSLMTAGGSFTLNVYTNTTWELTSLPSFMHCNTVSGSGDTVLTITYDATQSVQRDGDIVFDYDFFGGEVRQYNMPYVQQRKYESGTWFDVKYYNYRGVSILAENIPENTSVSVDGYQSFVTAGTLTKTMALDESLWVRYYTNPFASGFTESAWVRGIYMSTGVTTVGASAFYGNIMTDAVITLSSNITSIGYGAFFNLSKDVNVKTNDTDYYIYLPNIVTIGDSAFYGNSFYPITNPHRVVLGNNIQSIGSAAFANIPIMGNLTISGPITSIGSSAFSGCSITGELTVNSTVGCSIGNSSFDTNILSSLSLSGITYIGDNAFRVCYGFTNSITYTGTTLGERAFAGCTGMTGINMPNVTDIGRWTFENCSSMVSATTSALTEFKAYSFQGCSSLTSVTFGTGLTYMGDYIFAAYNEPGCDSLTTIYDYATNKELESNSFYGLPEEGTYYYASGVDISSPQFMLPSWIFVQI